ncbi:MAG: TIGR04211 family SH3 domain-containing protein [Gammaproteobacteria bacterium]|nr:TIGR04211 family SH3 domain-containing protein [Gammaproteobacteria bacterium]NIR24616.1 TIGR04211 family SH3 domain-containing protein [Gammaproteobacteria bacterium]NIS06230.1 TIGR04211 family SH3 domain-containing protein [Gammaproteobacteria bacterium]NIW03502.1 TIGR04211 family SH3 domain-containing protein [Gammaproteobacteria bacterium]NIW56631.1 TIGR04211 family SH3 domain-containing protein [Gammaproteobacteria bacterium]
MKPFRGSPAKRGPVRTTQDMLVRNIALLCLLSLASWHVHAQSVRYVIDSLKLEARQGPSTSHRISHMLSSGTRVTVLEEDEQTGYSRVALDDGSEVWILTRYLMDEPAARARLTETLEKYAREREIARDLTNQLDTLGQTVEEIEKNRSTLARDKKLLQAELAQIKQAAADALSIKERNESLKKQVEALSLDLDAAQQTNRVLKERSERDWFIAGAGVLLGGMILGFVIPKIRWKRRRSWGEL